MKNNRLQQLFTGIINEQLAADKPAYVKTTLERLVSDGYSEEQAKTMMAGVVAYHMSNMINDDQPFDNEEYHKLLENLPDFPDTE